MWNKKYNSNNKSTLKPMYDWQYYVSYKQNDFTTKSPIMFAFVVLVILCFQVEKREELIRNENETNYLRIRKTSVKIRNIELRRI